jgi:hypothetical protein
MTANGTATSKIRATEHSMDHVEEHITFSVFYPNIKITSKEALAGGTAAIKVFLGGQNSVARCINNTILFFALGTACFCAVVDFHNCDLVEIPKTKMRKLPH